MATKQKPTDIPLVLESIRKKNGGILRAEDVVTAARPINHPLHSRFTWDNTEAAKQYRLWQAREMIRVTVTFIGKARSTTRAYVSLIDDRKNEGGGYRTIQSVMLNKSMRQSLLNEALAELKVFELKYHQLKELVPIFNAAQRVRNRAG